MNNSSAKDASRLVNGPQYEFDDIYITVFNEKRKFDEDGNERYEPIKKNLEPTGVRVFDRLLRNLSVGKSSIKKFCASEGLTELELSTLCFVLTGMNTRDFKKLWVAKTIKDLLRYTDLPLPEVARVSGAGSRVNLHYICHEFLDFSPHEFRIEERERLDLDRFRI